MGIWGCSDERLADRPRWFFFWGASVITTDPFGVVMAIRVVDDEVVIRWSKYRAIEGLEIEQEVHVLELTLDEAEELGQRLSYITEKLRGKQ